MALSDLNVQPESLPSMMSHARHPHRLRRPDRRRPGRARRRRAPRHPHRRHDAPGLPDRRWPAAGPGRQYGLEEASSPGYPVRIERSVLVTDGRVLFGDARSPGSMLTAELCERHGRPWLAIAPGAPGEEAAQRLQAGLAANDIRTLNVAGNRASQAPGIAAYVEAGLGSAFSADCRDGVMQPTRSKGSFADQNSGFASRLTEQAPPLTKAASRRRRSGVAEASAAAATRAQAAR
jgi:hypothetical protein